MSSARNLESGDLANLWTGLTHQQLALDQRSAPPGTHAPIHTAHGVPTQGILEDMAPMADMEDMDWLMGIAGHRGLNRH